MDELVKWRSMAQVSMQLCFRVFRLYHRYHVPFLTMPVRHLGNIEYGKETFSFGDTDLTNKSRKGMLCIDIIRPSASVTAAIRRASIELVCVWYTSIDIWKNMYVRIGIIIEWKM